MKSAIAIALTCALGLVTSTVPAGAASLSGEPWTRIDGASPVSGDPWTRIDGAAPLSGTPWTRIDGAAPVHKPDVVDTFVGE